MITLDVGINKKRWCMYVPSNVTYVRLKRPPTANAAGGANKANPDIKPATQSS